MDNISKYKFNKKKSLTLGCLIMIITFSFFPFSKIFGQQKITSVKHPIWSFNQTIYEVNVRQYTPSGTFREFETQLPRLKKMGVGILWLMPINPI